MLTQAPLEAVCTALPALPLYEREHVGLRPSASPTQTLFISTFLVAGRQKLNSNQLRP